MRLVDLLSEIEVQGYYEVVYYDDKKDERITIDDAEEAYDDEVNFIYVENDILYIEVEHADEGEENDV